MGSKERPREARRAIVAALRLARRPLTTPEIIAAVPLSRTAMFNQLAAMERDGVIIRDAAWKKPNRWHLATEEARSVAA